MKMEIRNDAPMIDVQIIDGRGYVWNADGTSRRCVPPVHVQHPIFERGKLRVSCMLESLHPPLGDSLLYELLVLKTHIGFVRRTVSWVP